MIVPHQAHDVLLADIAQACAQPEALHLWWLGQSGFLVQHAGRHVLLDPYLSDSLTHKYAATDKPHVRMTELAIAPERLDMIDLATSSHHHTDHLDGDTLRPLLAANPAAPLVVPRAHLELARQRTGCAAERLVPLNDGELRAVAGFTLHAVPAAHETVERDARGDALFLGYVVRLGPWTIFHSGDTVRHAGDAETLRRWKIDVALLPINGRGPERRVAGNLWGDEAAELAHQCGARLVVPCHYEMFTFNTAGPERFISRCVDLGQAYRVLRCGERLSIPVPAP